MYVLINFYVKEASFLYVETVEKIYCKDELRRSVAYCRTVHNGNIVARFGFYVYSLFPRFRITNFFIAFRFVHLFLIL